MTAIIRLAKLGEEAAIHEAHMRSIREVCVKDHGENEIRGWGNRPLGNRWTGFIGEKNVWVVEDEGIIRGVACMRFVKESGTTKAHLLSLYLTPEVLGRGHGAELMQIMLEKAHKEGTTEITLESSLTAHKFYLSFGFGDTGPVVSQEIAGYPVRCIPMSLRLG